MNEAMNTSQRHEIADRLHDGPVQNMAVALLFLDSALGKLPGDADARASLERAVEAIASASASCREIMRDLTQNNEEG